ncbi:uncharacterized protein LOC123321393 [Coccinella septempunctata]|uniref:uncharacterized protein LOC123321393 n=1 Tax=Coccinella septempunctata TaxID=41139 RepID=UPI001D096E9C|nr:uncharacterized protein LOC123321393 [Coccinella septempunctata]
MFSKLVLLMLYWFSSANIIAATRCYNCGTDNTDSCDNFDPSNSSFIVNCPHKFSCGLETHVDKKIRTCEGVFLDDCQKANNIEYCYCTGDLCNGNTIQLTPSDDEDYIEGSGVRTTTTISSTTTTISSTTTFKPQVNVTKLANGQQETAVANILLLHLTYICSSVFWKMQYN